jgi:chemotaxis protein CheY-P-specific phosphatase CheC
MKVNEHNRIKFNDLFMDSFKEASHSLSVLTNLEIIVNHPEIKMLNSEDFINQIEENMEDLYIGSTVKIMEEPNTSIVFLVSEKEGLRLYDKITGQEEDCTREVNKDVVGGIGEVNNILSSAFINNLANKIKKEICPSTPMNVYDMQGAILQGIILQDEFMHSKILCGESIITEKAKNEFRIRFFILTDQKELWNII